MNQLNSSLLLVILLIAFVSAAGCTSSGSREENTTSQPNVIILLTDDQGTLDAGCYGSKDLYTPNIDHLAKTGIRFTQAYAHTVCCPTRAALLTGRAPQRANVNTWVQGDAHATTGLNMYLDEVTIAEVLQRQGYRTGLFGKWHVGADLGHGPLEQGFDEFYGIRNGFIDNYNHFFLHNTGYHDLWENKNEVFEESKYFPDLITHKALKFIENNQDSSFFLYLGFNIPHYPEQFDEKFNDRYSEMEEPRKTYAKIVSTTDDRIGHILNLLEELDLRNNTLIFFVSDNGHSTEDYHISVDNHSSGLRKGSNYGANGGGGNTGKWRGAKGSFLEGGIRVPVIVSYPAEFPVGEARDQVISVMDFLPTICSVLDIDLPDRKLDGNSLLPIISTPEARSDHKVLYFQWQDRWAVREGNWKLIGNGLDTSGKYSSHLQMERKMDSLYLANLSDTRPEEKNYANEHPEIVKRLSSLYEKWAGEVFADAAGQYRN